MRNRGFEALADGVALMIVLLATTGFVSKVASPPEREDVADALRHAEEIRVALLRTELVGLGYLVGSERIILPNETTIETFLRIEVHLLHNSATEVDFSESNERILSIASRLLPPSWKVILFGGVVGGPSLLSLPPIALPPEHAASSWSYPSLDGTGPETRLTVAVWLSPPR